MPTQKKWLSLRRGKVGCYQVLYPMNLFSNQFLRCNWVEALCVRVCVLGRGLQIADQSKEVGRQYSVIESYSYPVVH